MGLQAPGDFVSPTVEHIVKSKLISNNNQMSSNLKASGHMHKLNTILSEVIIHHSRN